MNRKTYRLCLMAAIVIAIFSGILYYQLCQKQELAPKDGTFVWQEAPEAGASSVKIVTATAPETQAMSSEREIAGSVRA